MQTKLTIGLITALSLLLAASGGEIMHEAFRVQLGNTEQELTFVRMPCPDLTCLGEMQPTYELVCAYFSHYPHRCNVCGRNATYPVLYPELRAVNDVAKAAPKVKLIEVTTTNDNHTLVIHYDYSGRQLEETADFTNAIIDFRFGVWMEEGGIVYAVSTGGADHPEFINATRVLGRRDSSPSRPLKMTRIPAPPGRFQLLGVANTGGDSIMISAVRHQRPGGEDRVFGWLYVDNCPSMFGALLPFDLPATHQQE